jgi:hypothetical protein
LKPQGVPVCPAHAAWLSAPSAPWTLIQPPPSLAGASVSPIIVASEAEASSPDAPLLELAPLLDPGREPLLELAPPLDPDLKPLLEPEPPVLGDPELVSPLLPPLGGPVPLDPLSLHPDAPTPTARVLEAATSKAHRNWSFITPPKAAIAAAARDRRLGSASCPKPVVLSLEIMVADPGLDSSPRRRANARSRATRPRNWRALPTS